MRHSLLLVRGGSARATVVALALALALIGCGDEPVEDSVDARPGVDAACVKPVVFINGLTASPTVYTQGPEDAVANTSSVITGAATLGPATPDRTPAILAAVRLALEPLGVVVTDVDPGAAAHLEIVLVGTGWPLAPTSLSATPFACGLVTGIALIRLDPAFPDDFFAVIAAAAVGLMNGLEPVAAPGNCMGPSSGTCTFADGLATASMSRCGRPRQDQVAILRRNLVCP